MPFICPECQTRGSFAITHSLQLPPDSRSDDIALHVVACKRCLFQGIAVYEESRRGALESDAWEHRGYRIPPADLQRLIDAIRDCPTPHEPDCVCGTHHALGRKNARGRWDGLSEVAIYGVFAMQRAESE